MKAPSEEIYDKSTQRTSKSTFSGLQRCRWQNLRNPAQFAQKFELIAVQGHPRSSILAISYCWSNGSKFVPTAVFEIPDPKHKSTITQKMDSKTLNYHEMLSNYIEDRSSIIVEFCVLYGH